MDAVIVGGGLGGLASAVCLAGQGLKVTVLEGADQLGGKAGVADHEGVVFDTGPSLITLPESLDTVFRAGGSSLSEAFQLREIDRFRLVFSDAEVVLGHGLEGTLAGIEAGLGSAARAEAEAFLRYAEVIWREAAPEFLWAEAPGALSMLKLGPAKWMRMLRADPFRSMWSAICARVSDPRLRALFARFATYNGSDPRVAPATLNCIAWVELGLGAYGIEGGVYALVEALVALGRSLGVEYLTGTRVNRLHIEDGRIAGVVVDGQTLKCSAVVCNADVSHLAQTLLPGAVPETREPSTSGWTAVLKVPRRDRPEHTVLFSDPYLGEFEELFDRKRPPVDPTVYLCAQEAAHGRVGWPDHEPLFVMVNAPADGGDALGVRAAALERLQRAEIAPAGVDVVWERTPRGLAERFAGSEGALYGAASNSRFAAFERPANRVANVPGLYLASGSAHPGGGVPLVMQSGRMAAERLIADRGGA